MTKMCTSEDNVYGREGKVHLHPVEVSGVLTVSTVYTVARIGTGVCAVAT